MLTTYGCSGSCCSSLFGFVCKQVSFRESLLALLSLLRLQCVLAQMNSNFLVLSSIRPEGPLAFNGISRVSTLTGIGSPGHICKAILT